MVVDDDREREGRLEERQQLGIGRSQGWQVLQGAGDARIQGTGQLSVGWWQKRQPKSGWQSELQK